VFGADTEAVLAEIGYTGAQIEAMRAEGVVPRRDGLPLT
jgi:crotonobetainyl-CoA:carnitine CoA-transferase CaiB-like acyl-CoA transferase